MSTTYPIPRQTRLASVTATAGQTVFGPFDFRLFDSLDVKVYVNDVAVTSGFTVAPASPAVAFPALFTLTFAIGRALNDKVVIFGARVQERLNDVTLGGVIRAVPLETELDRESIVLQELRRDVDATVRLPPGESGIVLPGVASRKGKIFGFDPVTGDALMLSPSLGLGDVLGPVGAVDNLFAVFNGDGQHLKASTALRATADGIAIISGNAAGADNKTGLLLDRIYGTVGDSQRIVWGALGTGIETAARAAVISAVAVSAGLMALDFATQTGGGDALTNQILRLSDVSWFMPDPTGKKLFVGRNTAPAQTHGLLTIGDGVPVGTYAGTAATKVFILDGSNASPANSNASSLMVTRIENLTGGATNAYSAAITGETVGLVGSTSEADGVHGYATMYGTHDAVGILGIGIQNGIGGSFGGYFRAIANVATADGQAVAMTLVNNAGTNFTFNGAYPSTNRLLGIDVEGAGANRSNAGIAIRATTANAFDVGLGFLQQSTFKADIQSESSATTILLGNGSHTSGIDLRAGTFSGNPFASLNFLVDASGKIASGTATTNLQFNVKAGAGALGGFGGQAWIEDSSAMALGVGGGLMFAGAYTSGGANTPFAGLRGIKENGTTGNFAGALVGYVNDGATGGVEAFRFKSTRALQLAAYGTGLLHSDSSGNITSSGVAVGDFANTTANRLHGTDGSGNGTLVTLPAAGLTLSAGAIALANDLAVIEALTGTGFPERTGTDTYAMTGFTGTGNVVRASSPTLVTPALGTPSALVLTNATGLPIGAFANTTANRLHGTDGSGNGSLITLPAAGLTLSAGAIALANDLAAVEALSSTGIARRTGTDAWSVGTLVGLTSEVTGILPGANGGTNNGFMQFSGPASSLKTFTLPNASDTIACLGQNNTFGGTVAVSLATPSVTINTTVSGNAASFLFTDAGTLKFQMGLQTVTDFFFYDAANTAYMIQYTTAAGGGTLKLMPGNGKLWVGQTTAIPAGGTQDVGIQLSSTAHFGVFFGSGAPTLSAAKGSIYLRSDGSGTGDRAYINTNGSTTWTALTTAA